MTDNKEAAENEAVRNLAKEGAKKPLPSAWNKSGYLLKTDR